MISSFSRYANSSLVTETINGDDIRFITPSSAVPYTFSFVYHVWTGTDRLDNVADAYLGNPNVWYLIGFANPQIINWFSIEPGTIIRIPKISVSA